MTAIRTTAPVAPALDEEGGRTLIEDALTVYRMDPGLAMHRAAEAALLRKLTLAGPILDLGCHDGGFSWLAFRGAMAQARIIGADRDFSSLARCRMRGVHRGLVGLDATRLSFRNDAFGSVICNSVLTHVVELPAVLREIARVLAPGGILAATVPTADFHGQFAPVRLLRALRLPGAARRVEWEYDRKWHQKHFLGRQPWRGLLADAGLTLETWTEYLGRRSPVHWSALFLLTRAGVGPVTLGALLRRAFPAGATRSRWIEGRLAAWLAGALGPDMPGGSALLVARRAGR